jgi:hypothetical protein
MPLHTMPEKSAFVHDLIDSVRAELMRDIAAGKIPEHWDGVQLRALTAERFARSRMGREGDRRFWRDYRNDVTTRNL